MSEGFISVIDAGKHFNRPKATIFKVMKRLGITASKRRKPASGNQVVSYLSLEDFARVRAELLSSEPKLKASEETGDGFISAEIGVFYIIQREPRHDPLRFVLGFASNIDDRLRALRCSAPFAEIVATYPCRRLWEKTAIGCVTSGCDRIHTEVFRCESLESIW